MDCWELIGTKQKKEVKKKVSAAETESGVKKESGRPRKKARKEAPKEAREEPSVEERADASKVPSTQARSEASTVVGGMTKEQIEQSFKDIADTMREGFGMCLKEIKLLGDRMEAVEKKVGVTKKGTACNDLQITTSSPLKAPVHEHGISTKTSPKITEKRLTRESSESVNEAKAGAKAGQNEAQEPSGSSEPSSSKELSLVIAEAKAPKLKAPEPSGEPSALVLDKRVPTASDIQKGETRRQTKKDIVMAQVRGKSKRDRKHAASQQSPFKGNSTAKQIIPNKKVGQGYDPFVWVDKKMSKLLNDWLFQNTYGKKTTWMSKSVLSQPPNLLSMAEQRSKSSAIYLPVSLVPSFCKSEKVWGVDVDDIYAPVNFRNEHWFAIWVSIPRRHIVIWDSIHSHISPERLDELMEPFVTMIPYLLVECTGSDEERVKHTLEPYKYERPTVGVPQCRSGDCGLFTLKYIECHALGLSFPATILCNKNSKAIREKMVVEIFKEIPDVHGQENQDNDENLATYEERG
ncbi:hypothetical protein Bca4012_083910 [Brassica carinata]